MDAALQGLHLASANRFCGCQLVLGQQCPDITSPKAIVGRCLPFKGFARISDPVYNAVLRAPTFDARRADAMAWRVGVDIGGTFTDVALIDDATGAIGVAKVPTTPYDFAEGVLAALDMAMRRYGVAAADVGLLAHATTVVTNAILQEKGARAALIATRGFRDVLELRRSARADLYDLFQDAPTTLIPRRRRYEITERIGADASIVTPLVEGEIEPLIAALKADR